MQCYKRMHKWIVRAPALSPAVKPSLWLQDILLFAASELCGSSRELHALDRKQNKCTCCAPGDIAWQGNKGG